MHARHPGPLDASPALRRVPLSPELLTPPPARGLLGRLRHELADDLVAIVYEANAAEAGPGFTSSEA
jgi:hypothetical protein